MNSCASKRFPVEDSVALECAICSCRYFANEGIH